jgi:O-antigen/teichoic acid export membrane protein
VPLPRCATRQRRTTDQALRQTLATNVSLAGLGVITGILAARLLGPSGEGKLAAIQTWPILLATLAMLGLDLALVYFISREPERGKQFTSTATLIGFVSAFATGAIAWFILPLLLSAQTPQVISAARVFLLIGVIYAVVGMPMGSLRGAREFRSWNAFRLAPGLIWLCILLISWLLFNNSNAIPLSRWYLAGFLLCGLPLFAIVNRKLRGSFKPDLSMAPEMLRFGLPSALTSLPQAVNLRFDQLLIIAFLPARSLGFYVVAVSWSGAVAPLMTAIGSVVSPHVSAERDTERQGHLLATALQAGALLAVATSVPFMLLAPFTLPLVFGSSFAPSIPSAIILVPAGAVLAWAGIAEEGLRGLGRPTIVLVAEVIAAAVTVGALPVLLDTYGIFGAAIASLLGYSVVAIITIVAISRTTNQKLRLLVVPTWSTTISLVTRSLSLLPLQHGVPGRHSQRRTR